MHTILKLCQITENQLNYSLFLYFLPKFSMICFLSSGDSVALPLMLTPRGSSELRAEQTLRCSPIISSLTGCWQYGHL